MFASSFTRTSCAPLHRSLTICDAVSWTHLPSEHVLDIMIAVGKAVKSAMPKGGPLAVSEVVVQDRFT